MQKEIKVSDYLKKVGEEILKAYWPKEPTQKAIETQAKIFFRTFGREVSEKLVGAYVQPKESNKDAWDSIDILQISMGDGASMKFMIALKKCCVTM